MAVKIGIHDDDIPPDFHAATDPNRLGDDQMDIPVDVSALADEKPRVFGQLDSDSRLEGAAFNFNPTATINHRRHGPPRESEDYTAALEVPPKPESAQERGQRHAIPQASDESYPDRHHRAITHPSSLELVRSAYHRTWLPSV